uniref:Ras association domain family member 3 n=1 Tax=Sinocyclocheilus grahami TaxID=75366 RepID=A0A672P158_SINGR
MLGQIWTNPTVSAGCTARLTCVLTFLLAKCLYSLSVFQDVEKGKELRTHLTYEDIRQKVEQYNTKSRDHFKMTLVKFKSPSTLFLNRSVLYTCKLSEEEHPLFLRLVAGPSTDTLSFVLKEQQTGEVMWDAFSIPELQNFLRILEKEEQDQICSMTRRYNAYREKLEEAMKATGGPG